MTLTTHGVVGAAVVALLPTFPALALPAALASHYLCDRIPHWDMWLHSGRRDEKNHLNSQFVFNRKTFIDLFKISFDFALGLTLAYFLFITRAPQFAPLVFVGALLGMLPDLLQFFYYVFRGRFLTLHQRFHHFTHSPTRLDNRPVLGISLQLLLILAVTLFVYYI